MNILRALMTSVLRMASPKYLSANMVWKCLKPIPLAEAREITELEILEAHDHAVHRYVAEQED